MFKIRYKSHHDVGNIISKFTQNLKASKNDFLDLLNTENKNKQLGIYFHTPYCDKICSFCNMSRKQLDNDLEEYTKYLCEEIKKYGAYEFCKTSEIEKMVDEVLANNQKMVEDYKAADEGRKPRILKGIVGQVMKISKGKANPEIVNELIMEKLK